LVTLTEVRLQLPDVHNTFVVLATASAPQIGVAVAVGVGVRVVVADAEAVAVIVGVAVGVAVGVTARASAAAPRKATSMMSRARRRCAGEVTSSGILMRRSWHGV
jgi:hypothetical protein